MVNRLTVFLLTNMAEAPEDALASAGSGDNPLKILFFVLFVAVLVLIVGTSIYIFNRRNREEIEEDDVHTISPEETGMKTVKLYKAYNGCPFRIGSVHDIGRRSMQQDSFGVSDIEDETTVRTKGILTVVADGMGGLSDGERMSQLVVVNMLQGFDEADPQAPSPSVLMGLLDRATSEVNNDLGPDKLGKCGSTVVATIIKDRLLSFISVGDSHIYVWRKGSLVKINKDHNYAAELDELVARGEISLEDAMSDPQRAALTSFIGMGKLEMVDQNINPIELMKDDRVLLMSDGIYGTLGDEKISEFMNSPLKQSCMLIDNEIRAINKGSQDNYTCIIVEIK